MHHEAQPSSQAPVSGEAVKPVLNLAKRLHKAALSEQLSLSLPVLRRVLATRTLYDISLPELRQSRSRVQRKHILRTLAIESGYPSWEEYRQALSSMVASDLEHYDLIRPTAGYPNLWFPSVSQAAKHVVTHGGQAIRVGDQGVVISGSREQS